MLSNIFKTTLAILVSFSVLTYAADDELTLAYVEWSSEIASANLVKAVLEEKMNVDCKIVAVSADEMWKGVSEGRYDAMVAAWLPQTHDHYYEQYEGQFEDLGANLEGAKIGLVVPDVSPGRQTGGRGQRNRPYITIDSIDELNEHAEKFDGRIIGIDPESGVMKRTEQALETYNLEDLRLIEGSETAMTAELAKAIQHKEWVVVTGWQPHWMFGRWTMKFLDDPKGVYGGEEEIHTIVRLGLRDDMPEVYEFLDKFKWTPDEMDKLMVWNQMQDGDPYRSAVRWLRYNDERWKEWIGSR
jgi:glycine betaine/proline transport system substrate-binding protein